MDSADLQPIVERLRAHTGDKCFACGQANPVGLHLDGFATRDGDITASFAARPDYQGTLGNLHGGVVATALDEILVWAGILQEKVLTVTAKLELRYALSVSNDGQLLRLRGRVTERTGRRLTISGELENPDGAMAVSAHGLYIVSQAVDDLLAGQPPES